MVTLEAAIAGLIADWDGDTTVERDVFASDDPASIAARVDQVGPPALGAGVEGWTFAERSVGVVLGLWLEGGREAVGSSPHPQLAGAHSILR